MNSSPVLKSEVTPLPWQAIPRETTPECCDFSVTVYDIHSLPSDTFVGEVSSNANAAFLVRAANSHEALVQALEKAEALLSNITQLSQPRHSVMVGDLVRCAAHAAEDCRSALSKAKEA